MTHLHIPNDTAYINWAHLSRDQKVKSVNANIGGARQKSYGK